MGILYTVVFQALILYRLETWVTSPWIGKTLVGFHHQVLWRLTGQIPQQNRDGTWSYPNLEEEIPEVGMREVENYAACCHNTLTQFIITRPIMDLCLAAARYP